MWYRFAVAPRLLSNPIVGGFLVEKENELGDVELIPVEYGREFGIRAWKELLNTQEKNLASQEAFNNFLANDKRFKKDENGKNIFVKDTSNESKNFIIPFDFDVYDDESQKYIPIKEGEVYNQAKLIKLLDTHKRNFVSQETFNNFLSDSKRFNADENGKYIYFKNPRGSARYLIIPFDFDVYDDESQKYIPIKEGEVLNITELKKLLKTDIKNLISQETFNIFLNNPQRFESDENGNLRYKSISLSNRESLFYLKFQNYNNDFISVQKQEKIRISFKNNQNKNINKILKLDFVFKKNNQILLAIEINGSQHYGFVPFNRSKTYDQWQNQLNNDVLKINYCHNNNIPLLIFNHMLSDSEFKTILSNLYENPNAYAGYIPQSVIDKYITNTSLEFIKRQIYSHLYPVFDGTITFNDDESKKRYIKDTLILISKLMGIYKDGIDKTDYIRAFDTNVDLTSNYNECLAIYNSLYPDFPLDKDEKITYSDLSKKPKMFKEKSPIKEPTEIIPSEE